MNNSESTTPELCALSKLSAEWAPEPLSPIVIPEKQSFFVTHSSSVFAMGFAFLLIIAVTTVINNPMANKNRAELELVYQEVESDRIFMEGVDTLIDSVLYTDVYPEPTNINSKYDFSDEFFDIITPI